MRRSDKVGLTVAALVLGAVLAAAIVADLGLQEQKAAQEAYETCMENIPEEWGDERQAALEACRKNRSDR